MTTYDAQRRLWLEATVVERALQERLIHAEGPTAGRYLARLWYRAMRRAGRRRMAYTQARLAARGVGRERFVTLCNLHVPRLKKALDIGALERRLYQMERKGG